MTILAQHGWGKSDKIERGIVDGSIHGVIMSPRDESPTNLASFLVSIADKHPSVERFVDPQLYAGSLWPVRDGKLLDYGHYRQHLEPSSFSPTAIGEFVDSTLSWQTDLRVTSLVSPTVMVEDLGSQWAQIAMMLAQESVARHEDSRPLLVSLAIGEDALRQQPLVDSWLNDLTRLDVDGFYLVVRRSSESYRQHYDQEVLSSLLRVCYSLAELNQYRLYVGYSDMVTLLLHAVGVTGTGAGWFSSLRQFNWRRFQPVSGGSQARARYSSRPLLNSIYMTELDAIYNRGLVDTVLSDTPYDERFSGATNPENVPWPPSEAALHHWQVLDDIARLAMTMGHNIQGRLDLASTVIASARTTYTQLESLVPFTTETGSIHLDQWLKALNRFRSDAAV